MTNAAKRPPRRRKAPEPLDPQGEIGAKLRALYAEVEREPIPTSLIELLEKLDAAEQRSQK